MRGIYIENPKKWICLWAVISTKETTQVFKHKTRLTLHFLQINVFSRPNVRRILSRISIYYFVDISSKETWMVVSMNETSSAPEGMKC